MAGLVEGSLMAGTAVAGKQYFWYRVYAFAPVVNMALMEALFRIRFMQLGTGDLMLLSSAPWISQLFKTSQTAILFLWQRAVFSLGDLGYGSPKTSERTGQKRLRGCP